MTSKTVGFVGFGIMGESMANNLLDADFPAVGHNRSPEAVDRLVENGGERAETPEEAAERADVVVTCLPDSKVVEEVVLGEDGVAEGLSFGDAFVDTSTIKPTVAEQLADELGEMGVSVLDAPISGGEEGAIDGSLSIMIGVRPTIWRPSAMSSTRWAGPSPTAAVTARDRSRRPATRSSSRAPCRPSARRSSSPSRPTPT